MKKLNKKGFTLVELIVVIAIIGILAAVLVPTITGYIQKARISNDISDCKNMNTLLVAYGYDRGVDLTTLEAPEVRYIVSLENKNYTFVPRYKNGVFWYDQKNGKIVYSQNGVTGGIDLAGNNVYADADYEIDSIEEIRDGYLYLNTQGELANALLKLRNLNSQSVYNGLKSTATFEGINLTDVIKTFDPSTTLFVTTSGGFTGYNSTGVKYSNMPKLLGDKWYWSNGKDSDGNDTHSSDEKYAVKVNGNVEDPEGDYLDSTYTTVSWTGGQLLFQGINGSKLITVTNPDHTPSTIPDAIHRVVFADSLTVVPALHSSNIYFDDSMELVLPVYTRLVMPEAFTNVRTQTKIKTKLTRQSVQYVAGSLSVEMNAANNITYVDLDDLTSNITDNACLLTFQTIKDNQFNEYKVTKVGEIYKLQKRTSEDKGVNWAEWNEVTQVLPGTATAIVIEGEIINPDNYSLKIITRDLGNAYPDMDILSVNYEFRQGEVNATIRAFDSNGMVINIVLCYKNKNE